MARFATLTALIPLLAVWACAQGEPAETRGCRAIIFSDTPFTVCTFDAARDDIRLFHAAGNNLPYGQFDAVATAARDKDETLVFAMNGGMYHDNRDPVGHYIEDGTQKVALNTNAGPGNFHLLPNGVFWLEGDAAGVSETSVYAVRPAPPRYATQSGPMLVIDGQLHPDFNASGTSRKVRNGVGVMADGRTVQFAISDAPVNFHTFGRLFRDRLKTPNALFLDGTVSKLYAPQLGRNDAGLPMGPIVGVVE